MCLNLNYVVVSYKTTDTSLEVTLSVEGHDKEFVLKFERKFDKDEFINTLYEHINSENAKKDTSDPNYFKIEKWYIF